MEGEKACPSKTEDGDQCGFKLTFGFKWCPGCGAKVDPALFQKKGKYTKYSYYQSILIRSTVKADNKNIGEFLC